MKTILASYGFTHQDNWFERDGFTVWLMSTENGIKYCIRLLTAPRTTELIKPIETEDELKILYNTFTGKGLSKMK